MIYNILVNIILLGKKWQKNYRSWWRIQGGNIKNEKGNGSVDDYETSDNFCDNSIIKTTRKGELLIQRLMTMNFKCHLIHYVINIVRLCGGK